MTRRTEWRRTTTDYAGILVGSAVTALALDWFLVPNKIAAGGVSGLATVTFHVLGWPVGLTMLAVNLPLFLATLKMIGLRFGLKTVVGAVATALFVEVFAQFLQPLTRDAALASIYGGVLAGVGVGITFRYGGSTGGTDMAARLLQRLTPMSVGQALLVIDGLVILVAGIVFNPELALYAFLSVFLTSKTIDLIQEGREYGRAAFIISDESQAIGAAVLQELDRGATSLQGKGLFTGSDREVLFVIVGRHEIQPLRSLVRRIDPNAFMVITDVSDVLGEGFRTHDPARDG